MNCRQRNWLVQHLKLFENVLCFLCFHFPPKHMIVQEQPKYFQKRTKQNKTNKKKTNKTNKIIQQVNQILLFFFVCLLVCLFFFLYFRFAWFAAGFFLGIDGEIIKEKKRKKSNQMKGPHSGKRGCVELYSCTLCIIVFFFFLQSHHSSSKQNE